MNWYQSRGINPEEKVTIFSDGLTYSDIVRLSNKYQGRHIVPFGWGTMLTNNFAGTVLGNENMRPFSMVVKAVEADGRPCVKLSNNPEKAMGPKQEVERYLRVFGSEGHVASRVLV
jgi:nicotinate phosphoribosyltransferase